MKILKVNELKQSTYRSAADKLSRMGGIHKKRSDEILKWSNTQRNIQAISKHKSIGEFNLNLDIVDVMYSNRVNRLLEPMTGKSMSEHGTKIKSGPIPCYFIGIEFESDIPIEGDLYQQDDHLIFCNFFGTANESSIDAFTIFVPIKWDEKTFKINTDKSVRIEHGFNEFDAKILFSDRKSAFKFKSKILANLSRIMSKSNVDYLREVFMTYSTAIEHDKLYQLISQISVNSLYE